MLKSIDLMNVYTKNMPNEKRKNSKVIKSYDFGLRKQSLPLIF